ncbi:NAD(P)-binding protein, partial [Pleomassaria siparia CBS 279.74]
SNVATINVRGAVKIPKGVTPSQAAVATNAVTTAYHTIHRRGGIKKSETVFLFGLGGLGFNALQIIRAVGAKVLVSDVKQENLEDAVKIGIPKEDIVPTGKHIQEWVIEHGWTGKIDIVADFVVYQSAPLLKQRYKNLRIRKGLFSSHKVRQAGRMLCVGTLNHETTVYMKVGIRKRLSIIFSYGGQTQDLKEALDLIAQRVLDPIVADGKLADFPRTLKDLEDGKVKRRIALLHE